MPLRSSRLSRSPFPLSFSLITMPFQRKRKELHRIVRRGKKTLPTRQEEPKDNRGFDGIKTFFQSFLSSTSNFPLSPPPPFQKKKKKTKVKKKNMLTSALASDVPAPAEAPSTR